MASPATVVVPSLDPGPDRLARCLDSLAAQSHRHVEVIVVDGGSTDGSRALASARDVTLIVEDDDGQADAIQRGFDRATGEVLGWLGADDTLLPDAVERAVRALDDCPDAGWAYGSVHLVGAETDEVLVPPARLDRDAFYWGCPVSQPGSLIRRAALDDVGWLDRSYHYAMDLDLWVRLVQAGYPGVRVDGVLATFEVHPGSKTGSAGEAPFLLEEARSYRDHGWVEAAALLLGQAVATSHPWASVAELRSAVVSTCREPAWRPLRRELVLAGAVTRAAIDGLRDGSRGLRYLFHPSPWRHATTRRRLGVAGRRVLARAVGRDPGRIQNR